MIKPLYHDEEHAIKPAGVAKLIIVWATPQYARDYAIMGGHQRQAHAWAILKGWIFTDEFRVAIHEKGVIVSNDVRDGIRIFEGIQN